MLGPALTLLFNKLDGRMNELTLYEKRLHGELLVLKLAGEKLQESRPDGALELVVRPRDNDDGGSVRLQINCDNINCPNREFR